MLIVVSTAGSEGASMAPASPSLEATKASLLAEAGELLRAGASVSHGPSCGRLARWHLFGVGGVPVDVEAAWGLCLCICDQPWSS